MVEQREEKKETTDLTNALSFLCSQKRTGKLLIRNEEGGEGEVYLVDGMITHAQFDKCAGLQAVLFIHSWDSGTYNFTPKQTSGQKTVEMETSRLFSLLAKRRREWRLINESNPLNLKDIFCLLPQARGTIRVKKEEWDILARINGRRSLREISDELYLPPLDLIKAIQRFRKAGLVGEGTSYAGTTATILGKDFLSRVEEEFSLAVGPLARVLLEDALKDIEEAGETLAEDKIELLLEKLSGAITTEEKKARFQQTIRILAVEFFSKEKIPQAMQEQEGNHEEYNNENIGENND
ncbi:MAG: DUF4388 domain-containing protein [Deltaproteobacteria bacterium]|nr:DUF4388 domain-containing protein [Deltaproteobacteria bacterium]